MEIKKHLQFNERFTRMLTRDSQMLRAKVTHKEQQFRSSNHHVAEDVAQTAEETMTKEICSFYDAQQTCDKR